MSSKGKEETEKLKENLNEQLQRLLQQLADIEEFKDEVDASEYEESKANTLEELQELNERLTKMTSGDITLVDGISAMQLATQSAISAAFHTPEVIRMFAKREPEELRERLTNIERDSKLGHIEASVALRKKAEVLSVLRQLGDKLSPAELQLLANFSKDANLLGNDAARFVHISEEEGVGEKALGLADNELKSIKEPM